MRDKEFLSSHVVSHFAFEGICTKENSADWQEKLTDLVLMHYKETFLFIDFKQYVQETVELRILI